MTQLHLQLHGATAYLNNPWSFGVNVSRCALIMRKEIQRHLLQGRDELGFRHVRFHGVFDDDMKILQPDGSYDFTHFEQVIDWLMENGLSPFIGLSGVPASMAAPDLPMPADLEKWADMVKELATFIDSRYGCDAQEWHFEVWREPDHSPRWSGTQQEYFRLYDLAARAIKSVNPNLKVGGPGATDPAWVEAFVDHVFQPSTDFGLDMSRCDFVSVSGMSDDAGGLGANELVERVKRLRQKVTDVHGEIMPLMLSSWSAGGRSHGPEHDRCGAAAVIVGTIAPLADSITGAFYWNMSDADADELRYEPFHGGSGLITVNDVHKASFNVFKLLNEHVGYKVDWSWTEPTEGLTTLVTRDYHHVVRILASYDPASPPGPARFTLEGLPESVKWGQVQVLRPGAGSPLETWSELGKPPFVNRFLLDDLDSGAHPAMTEVNFRDFPPRLEPGMTLQLTIPIPDDVMNTD
jgi:xylan 1,4-beta-xylosidase